MIKFSSNGTERSAEHASASENKVLLNIHMLDARSQMKKLARKITGKERRLYLE